MKQKDIDKCSHINLSTSPKDILQTMLLEMPTVDYFFHKNYGGNRKWKQHEDQLLDKALAEKESQVTDISEYISRKGNRWMSYTFAEYFPKALHAQAWPTSFIYYETYGSCGAFFPMFRPSKKDKKTGKATEVYGVIIYTSHFFQRMSERTGKAYRSRELIQEFITTMQTRALQADEDGEVIVKFKGGYGFGVKRCDDPMTLEVRTFLADEQLSPSQRRKCERVDAWAELLSDGDFLKEVAIGKAYHSNDTPEQVMKESVRSLELAKKIGAERMVMLAGLVHMTFVRLMTDILGMDMDDISEAQNVYIAYEIKECYAGFIRKYENFDGRKASKEQNDEFEKDLVDVMVKCGKKMKLRSMTREAIVKRINEIVKGQ